MTNPISPQVFPKQTSAKPYVSRTTLIKGARLIGAVIVMYGLFSMYRNAQASPSSYENKRNNTQQPPNPPSINTSSIATQTICPKIDSSPLNTHPLKDQYIIKGVAGTGMVLSGDSISSSITGKKTFIPLPKAPFLSECIQFALNRDLWMMAEKTTKVSIHAMRGFAITWFLVLMHG